MNSVPKFFKYTFSFIVVSGIAGVLAIAGLYFYIKPDLPSVETLKDVRLQTPMKVYTSDGKLISQFGVKRRIPLKLEEAPQQLIEAVLATEDSRFYEHPGIDPIGIVRAAINLILTGEKGQGGSTLTMQLARGFFLTRDKTYIRKLKEIFIAWHIERVLSKDEILQLYLNKVELGHRAFGFGAAAQVYYGKNLNELSLAQIATLAGLPKAPSTLNPISRPERSVNRRKVVLSRMLSENYITEEEYISSSNEPVTASRHGAEIELDAPYLANVIYKEMIELYGKEEAETGGYQVFASAPYELQKAAQEAVKQNLHDYDERHGYRGSVRQLWRKSDPDAQTDAPNLVTPEMAWSEQKIINYLKNKPSYKPLIPAVVTDVYEQAISVIDKQGRYHHIDWDGLAWARPFISDNKQGKDPQTASDIVSEGAHIYIRQRVEDQQWQLSQFPEASGAFVSLDPNNGAVRALVGGYSFYQSQFNRATQAKRQVGSNIKPFLYSAALDEGYTIASIINDAPINQWDRSSGRAWRPENSPPRYDGPIRMRVALGQSKNVVAVRLLRAVGIDNVRRHMQQYGFELDDLPRDESLSLGSASITPLEVANGFATIANGGFAVQPYFIERIETQFGEFVWQANPLTACPVCDQEENLTAQLNLPKADQAPISEPLPPQAEQVITAQNVFLVKEMLRTAVTGAGSWKNKTFWQGTGWRANNILKRKDLAGKTGTTNDSKDTWFSGFNPNLVATSWVGFDDPSRSLGRTSSNRYLKKKYGDKANWIGNGMSGGEDGAKSAQPAWIRFMQVALRDMPVQDKVIPDGVVQVRIDRTTGKLTSRTDHTSKFEYFISGTEPTEFVASNDVFDPADEQSELPEEEDDIF